MTESGRWGTTVSTGTPNLTQSMFVSTLYWDSCCTTYKFTKLEISEVLWGQKSPTMAPSGRWGTYSLFWPAKFNTINVCQWFILKLLSHHIRIQSFTKLGSFGVVLGSEVPKYDPIRALGTYSLLWHANLTQSMFKRLIPDCVNSCLTTFNYIHSQN